jgi:Asp-tRNA(Asn)/Glu-tRNA(Gln) amidotransferase A subunit family amidase
MPAHPSPLQSLRDELASSSTTLPEIAIRFAANANSNASHNTYLGSYSTEALHRAEQLPRIFPDQPSRPSLYGIPISIKDCFDIAGTITTCGARFYEQHNPPAPKNSWVAQRVLDCGAILTGKTHLHQLAYGVTGENPDYGDCLQPRNPTLLTGGSSSGAAASVQEGSALAAIGTDTGGSIRIPSALCGLAGYRASHAIARGKDREDREDHWSGGYHLAQTFDTIG